MNKLIILWSGILLSISCLAQENTSWNRGNAHLSFVKNHGQFDGRDWNKFKDIDFAYNHNPFTVFFTKKGLTYRFDHIIKNKKHKEDHSQPKRINKSELIFVEWVNANKNIEVEASEMVDHCYTYAIGKGKATTSLYNIKGYRKITYKNVYDNIDFEYLIHPEGGIKYNVILHPGANPDDIQLKYTSNTTHVDNEHVTILLNENKQVEIETSRGKIVEHQPISYYENNRESISSSYLMEENTLKFNLADYDPTQTVVIDPWIVSPSFNSSSAVWEVETDGAGNVYTIGGETPMELWKYNSSGVLQWQYVTPWDTNSVWLGTLATDASGNSYVTSGVTAEMHKVNSAGNFVWDAALSGGLQWNSEWWSITFNCDETKLITGGTWVNGILTFDYYAGIFEIDVATGSVISDQIVDFTNVAGFGATPVEVRSISSSKNSKFIFLTHNDVGAINENFGSCPNEEPIFQIDNGHNLGYKCENYLPYTQNGGGLKALVANDNYIYTHSGDQIHRRDLTTGALINSVALPGGNNSVIPFFGGIVVENSGLDVDDCGNVYAGSGDRVVKFDASLNIISQINTTFTVYDVSVNSNGEVIACGAQLDNDASNTNRNGRIESLNMGACSQYSLICCDANFCNPGDMCATDPSVLLSPSTPGGTWSGPGVDASGNFNPAIAGAGTHTITYTLACGSESVSLTVDPCSTLEICEETNGELTVSGGNGTYTWSQGTVVAVTTPITTEQECIDCPSATPQYIPIFGFYTGCDLSDCPTTDTTWTQYATGTTTPAPSGYPIQVVDGNGITTVINNAGELVACTVDPCAGVTIAMNIDSQTDVSCFGGSNGSATISATGGTAPYAYLWAPGLLSGSVQSSLSAGTYTIAIQDNAGCPGSGSLTISEPAELIASASGTDATCGASDGSASASQSGGTGPFSYLWSPSGGSSANASGLTPGTYTVTITDNSGCTDDASVTISTTNGPSISLDASSDISCFGANDGSASVSASGGTPGYSYNWMPGSLSGASQSGLAPGTYTITVTDGIGCTDITTVDILEPAEILLSTSNIASANCGTSDGSATVDAIGGTGIYTYSWSPQGGTAATASNIPGGAYVVTVTDDSGCSEVINLTVPNIGGPTVSLVSASDASCFGETDGSAEVSVVGGSTPYSYSWAPTGGSNSSATGLAAGTYTVTVSDDTGCIGTLDVTIGQPTEIVITETVTDEDCGQANGSVSLSVSGGSPTYSYDWSPGGETTSGLSNLSAGSYSVVVTDNSGCIVSGNYTVLSIGGIPVVANPSNATILSGESVNLSATGADNYVWTPATGLSCTTCANPVASPNTTTTYIVTGTDLSGCQGADTLTIFVTIDCADLFVPTIFSPNGSGPTSNEFLCVYGNCVSELTFRVFDRWGEMVFETTTPATGSFNKNEICWDGNFRGQPVQSGAYVYVVYARLFDDTIIEESGNLTVVR